MSATDFHQSPPCLGNQFEEDPLLDEHLSRVLPEEMLQVLTPEFKELGALAAGELFALQQADRSAEPELIQWDPWGRRIDRISVTRVWERAKVLSAQRGLVAAAYDDTWGSHARVHMFAMNYLVQASLDIYSCPLAMSDGAARTLLNLDNPALVERAIPHLLSRDPDQVWTSGQWMTEKTGGSDVGLSRTRAVQDGETWRLHGTKWFTSAINSEMALTLARPEGNPDGGAGLALFYVETHHDGSLNAIAVNRLKDKLGTRKVPTAELSLDGSLAIPVDGTTHGIRKIASMLNITRTWNAAAAVWGMRRARALARDFATRRIAFGSPLSQKALHQDTLAGMQAEFEGAFHLAFWVVELLGRVEQGGGSDRDTALLRTLTPIAKLLTAKQGVAVASEALECFGGAGYVEDTGLPRILADMQVLPIWEGTTNVLSLDTLRALSRDGSLPLLLEEIRQGLAQGDHPGLEDCQTQGLRALQSAENWLQGAEGDGMEAGARRFALTVGRCAELSRALIHARWCLENQRGDRAAAAARRLTAHGLDLIQDISGADSSTLAR